MLELNSSKLYGLLTVESFCAVLFTFVRMFERFSIECRKTRIKVVILANNNRLTVLTDNSTIGIDWSTVFSGNSSFKLLELPLPCVLL